MMIKWIIKSKENPNSKKTLVNAKNISWAAVIGWMILIFCLSHQPAAKSNELSTGITEVIIKTIERVVPDKEFDIRDLNHVLRKNGHFFTYLVLGILVANAFTKSGMQGMRNMVFSLLVCILYAVTDEIHQLLVIGRGGQCMDVVIDSFGAITGIGLFITVDRVFKKVKRRSR
jgi:VanZ family protein